MTAVGAAFCAGQIVIEACVERTGDVLHCKFAFAPRHIVQRKSAIDDQDLWIVETRKRSADEVAEAARKLYEKLVNFANSFVAVGGAMTSRLSVAWAS